MTEQQKTPNQSLSDACTNADLNAAKQAVENGANVNVETKNNNTMLDITTNAFNQEQDAEKKAQYADVMKWLAENGALTKAEKDAKAKEAQDSKSGVEKFFDSLGPAGAAINGLISLFTGDDKDDKTNSEPNWIQRQWQGLKDFLLGEDEDANNTEQKTTTNTENTQESTQHEQTTQLENTPSITDSTTQAQSPGLNATIASNTETGKAIDVNAPEFTFIGENATIRISNGAEHSA